MQRSEIKLSMIKRAVHKWLISQIALLTILALAPPEARALPPPLSPTELTARSDLIIQGRVTKIWRYPQWVAYLKDGGLGTSGKALLEEAPATDEGLLRLIRNFPYKSRPGVAIDGIYLAQVLVEQTLKGPRTGVIFIPFVRFHFLAGGQVEGPWNERQYQVGEHLKMYLRHSGPFYESTWWNAVRSLDKQG